MAHELEIINGEASFAYDANGGNPWHRLGTAVQGRMTIMEGLKASNADYSIITMPVGILTGPKRGGHQPLMVVESKRATVRPHPLAGQPINPDDPKSELHPDWQFLGFVSEDYKMSQHEQVLVFAYALLGADQHTGRAIDTIGVLNDGKRFFASLKQPESIMLNLPNGAIDLIDEYLVIHTRHDGIGSTNVFPSHIRPVCNNTVTAGENRAKVMFGLSHRHDLDAEFDTLLQEARAAMNGTTVDDEIAKLAEVAYSDQLAALDANVASVRDDMVNTAMALGSKTINRGSFVKVIDTLWPVNVKDLTARQQTIRRNKVDKMVSIFESERNAGGYGDTGWAAVQALGEYMDHGSPKASVGRLRDSLIPTGHNQVWSVKEAATAIVLNDLWKDGASPVDPELVGALS